MQPAQHWKRDLPPAAAQPVRLGPRDFILDRKSDGTIYIRSPHKLDPYPDKITERLVHWAERTPDRVFMADRTQVGWRESTYADTLARIQRIAAALLTRNLSPERPIVILSGNDLEHQWLSLAAMHVGIPYAPVSPAYSLISRDFANLKYIFNLLTPGLVFVSDGAPFARAIEAMVPSDVELVVTRNPPSGRRATMFAELADATPTAAVDAAHADVGPDTIAKFLFTSGSTGHPKGVINTQRMLCSNQAMILAALRYFEDEPPVVLDWAPWHHTAGGNHDVYLVLYNGGSFYVDDGKPMPGQIEATVRNLRDVSPTWYFNVPKGFEALLPYLQRDVDLRQSFFRDLKVLWFAAAAVSQYVSDEYERLARETVGRHIPFLTGLGSTETAPFAIGRTWPTQRATNMGLPAPGLELKLIPNSGKLEARLRGPNITPGYWREPQLTANAFDDENYYKLGDALAFEDPDDPGKGLVFDGRIAEDFKLATGTWVATGRLRGLLNNAFAPYVRDVVLTAPDRDYLGALLFPDPEACRALAPDLKGDLAALVSDPRVRREFQTRLDTLAREATGSSNRVLRAMVLEEPPLMDAGEATDKGSINQRNVLKRRAAVVDELYAEPPSPRVITTTEQKA
ncbi:MAG: feruloyl-CoA synthase [Xanthobacteraceae bacterium]|nr:feruloyl-CoA synthase [Xanthobacteraceae bacterium]